MLCLYYLMAVSQCHLASLCPSFLICKRQVLALTALDFSEHQRWKLHEDTLYTVITLSTIVAKNHGDHLLPSFSPVLSAQGWVHFLPQE